VFQCKREIFIVQNAKPILDQLMSEDDYLAIAEATAKAYKACDEFFQRNIVTSNFVSGMQHRSDLINAFVEHALTNMAADRNFFFESKPNDAKNHWHIRLYKDRLSLTSHFLGRNGKRSKARSANCRAILASRNFDLFEDETVASAENPTHIYCQILHSGFIRPDAICLAIPTADQSNVSHSMQLSIPEPTITNQEQIREEMTLKLLSVEVAQNGSQ